MESIIEYYECNTPIDPQAFINLGQLLYTNNDLIFEDIFQYDNYRYLIVEGIKNYKNTKLIELKKDISKLKKEIKQLLNKKKIFVKNKKNYSYILQKNKIYEDTIQKLTHLYNNLKNQLQIFY